MSRPVVLYPLYDILMILSRCTRDTALSVQCEIIIKIYTHRVIVRRLCERTSILPRTKEDETKLWSQTAVSVL